MATEAFKCTPYADSVVDGLRWKTEMQKAHKGGPRKRINLLPLLTAAPEVKGASTLFLVDDLLSTGGSILASADSLEAAGAQMIGAITCGKTVYDFATPAFGSQQVELTQQLGDWIGG